MKLGSTGWRFVRFYTGHPELVRKGPPRTLLAGTTSADLIERDDRI